MTRNKNISSQQEEMSNVKPQNQFWNAVRTGVKLRR
jgi:hypothetical protein